MAELHKSVANVFAQVGGAVCEWNSGEANSTATVLVFMKRLAGKCGQHIREEGDTHSSGTF